MSTAADRVRAALALGIDVTSDELAHVQRSHHDDETAALVVSDPVAAATHPALAPEIRRYFAVSGDRTLAAAAGLHPAAPPSLIAATLARTDVQVLVSSAPARLTDDARWVLIEFGGLRERRAVARSTTDPALLDRLAGDHHVDVRVAAAWNTVTSAAAEAVLATDDDASVRAATARRGDLSPELLASLARDHELTVRVSVASNRNTPDAAARDLVHDAVPRVRQALASNPNTSAEVLQSLSTDLDDAVRCRVAANIHTPTHTLTALARDAQPEVRLHTARNPTLDDADVFRQLAGDVADSAIAANPSAPSDVLGAIGTRAGLQPGAGGPTTARSCTVAASLASNPATPEPVLEAIADWICDGDDDHTARITTARHLAKNPSASDVVLERLVDHPDDKVRVRLAQRSATGELASSIERKLMDDPVAAVREAIVDRR